MQLMNWHLFQDCFEDKCYSELFGDLHKNCVKPFSNNKILQIRETQLHEKR